MQHRHQFYIDGRWQRTADANDTTILLNPANESPIATIALASHADIDLAIDAARAALEGPWGQTDPETRGRLLHRIADLYERRAPHMAALICTEMGAPMSLCKGPKTTEPVAILRYYAHLTKHYPWDTEYEGMGGPLRARREPIGVTAAITAWNDPQWTTFTKLAPALAAGCTVILKPATETALDAYALASILEDAGIPPGVVNIVPAEAANSEYLVRHPGVAHVAFTGSTGAGRAVALACAENLKTCTLELGGKNAAIVLDDADPEATANGIKDSALFNNAQACISTSRIFLPASRYVEHRDALAAMVNNLAIGDPTDPATDIGPLATRTQLDRHLINIDRGLAAGATIAAGGPTTPLPAIGFYAAPVLFTGVHADMAIAQEELFSPILTIETYDDEQEAVALANGTNYGLAATVWTEDPNRGRALADHIDVGLVGINGIRIDPAAPFAGRRASGLGAELGPPGLDAYLYHETLVS